MELLAALIDEKWLAAALAATAYLLERQERLSDKKRFLDRLEKGTEQLNSITDVLLILRERIK